MSDEELLARYLGEIGAHPRLGDDEDRAVAATVRGGGPEATAARRRLIQAHLRLVSEIAHRRASDPTMLLDLIHEGNLGLLRAVDRYEPERASPFPAYATWWIRRAIARAHEETTSGLRRPDNSTWGDAAATGNISFALLERLAAPPVTIDDTGGWSDDTGPQTAEETDELVTLSQRRHPSTAHVWASTADRR